MKCVCSKKTVHDQGLYWTLFRVPEGSWQCAYDLKAHRFPEVDSPHIGGYHKIVLHCFKTHIQCGFDGVSTHFSCKPSSPEFWIYDITCITNVGTAPLLVLFQVITSCQSSVQHGNKACLRLFQPEMFEFFLSGITVDGIGLTLFDDFTEESVNSLPVFFSRFPNLHKIFQALGSIVSWWTSAYLGSNLSLGGIFESMGASQQHPFTPGAAIK